MEDHSKANVTVSLPNFENIKIDSPKYIKNPFNAFKIIGEILLQFPVKNEVSYDTSQQSWVQLFVFGQIPRIISIDIMKNHLICRDLYSDTDSLLYESKIEEVHSELHVHRLFAYIANFQTTRKTTIFAMLTIKRLR